VPRSRRAPRVERWCSRCRRVVEWRVRWSRRTPTPCTHTQQAPSKRASSATVRPECRASRAAGRAGAACLSTNANLDRGSSETTHAPRPFHACPLHPSGCTPSRPGARAVAPVSGDQTVTGRSLCLMPYAGWATNATVSQIRSGPEDGAPWVQRWRHDRSQFDADERHGLEGDPQPGWLACSSASVSSSGVVPAVPADGRCHRAMAPMTHASTHAYATSKQAVRPCDRSSLEPRGGRPGGMPTYAVPISFWVLTETHRTPFPRTGALESLRLSDAG
jgi:hypothetical protein